MPLVVITGIPSSGKTTTTRKIREFLENEKDKVVRVVDEAEYLKTGGRNVVLSDSRKEKELRGNLKSEVCRLLHKDEVVILDALNYIKGFRYELYCASKASKTTQCTVHCDVSPEDAWSWNIERDEDSDKYSKEVFDALVMRYEAPVGQNRWDSPLLLSLKSRPLDVQQVYDALFSRKAPPPNQSTQTQPLSSTNFLQELDRVTKEIVSAILAEQKAGSAVEGDEISVPGTDQKFALTHRVTLAELSRARRQFITYAKARAIDDVARLATMFVQYLNSNVGGGGGGGEDEG